VERRAALLVKPHVVPVALAIGNHYFEIVHSNHGLLEQVQKMLALLILIKDSRVAEFVSDLVALHMQTVKQMAA
jgi:hypothetical protein